MSDAPAWDDEDAVTQWVRRKLEWDAAPEPPSPDDKPWKPAWDESWARWRRDIFKQARHGYTAPLEQAILIAPLEPLTREERITLADLEGGRIKRKRGRPELFRTSTCRRPSEIYEGW